MTSSALKAHSSELKAHKNRLSRISMREQFAADKKRFANFAICVEDLIFDYSKNRIDNASMKALVALAKSAGVSAYRERMFSGVEINETEGRAVLHTALRNTSGKPVLVNGEDIMPDIQKVLKAMAVFSNKVRNGKYSVTGGNITDIVNIGIGGSDLGPAMATLALSPWHNGPRTHFVSNVDGADLSDTFEKIEPSTTLFIIASKTFTTQETMRNATSARNWLRKQLGKKDVGQHFAALSTNLEATRKFGIDDERTFGFWDWVGGRYSIWSAIGLSLMIAIGPKKFNEFLQGAHCADNHFQSEPYEKNIPVLMALLGVWNRNIWGHASHAVLPYDNRLSRFAAYLQQLDMESNGKRVMMNGKRVTSDTGAILWGEPGTNGQHAFYQLIHQGTSVIPCDFLIAAKPQEKMADHHSLLVANCLAQSEALMVGKTEEEALAELLDKGMSKKEAKALAPHKVFEGNRPSSTFLYKQLDPKTLGMLLAFYEHKVFVQGVIWGINSFDQWGVELGKVLASELVPMVKDPSLAKNKDASTLGLLASFHELAKSK
jgi:glucose-6-phosphate isomerase